ncbi:MAG TPA: deoxyribose-phosphate aldolase [Victivallales bacterium]|nr:deoxyribose-phosphate aldolase [Victivallales bacterium]HPO90641.1 deoxyribose-phosphate aldolase [Victivallales bacterium]HRU01736.1 deoxyribose-phosphate aldolase [Victivallales bacterium]
MNELARYIDHTLLKPTATEKQIENLCEEAIRYSFAAVCVNPYWVNFCAKKLSGTKVKVCSVVGFPLGATPTEVKAFETEFCLKNGAQEIDMVINIGAVKDKNWCYVEKEISTLAKIAHSNNAILKVIFENCLLEKDEIIKACQVSIVANADFVKTSTGFSTGGATFDDVKLMVETVKGKCKVKAAGGIRNAEDALNMIKIGAQRLGTSVGVAIVTGKNSSGGY